MLIYFEITVVNNLHNIYLFSLIKRQIFTYTSMFNLLRYAVLVELHPALHTLVVGKGGVF